MMRLTIGLSVLSTALLCALITTAVLLVGLTALDLVESCVCDGVQMSLDTKQHKLVMDQGVHSGEAAVQ